MTFRDLQKLVTNNNSSSSASSANSEPLQRLMDKLRDKPFWIWNKQEHKQEDIRTDGDCCFNHIIGLPQKHGVDKPLFDYQAMIYDTLFNSPDEHTIKHKHIWIKKATGLGITEMMLRVMVWLALRNDGYRNSQMCIVTGPNVDIAIKLVKRMKQMFEKHNVLFDSKETVLELNGCRIEAYPSNHVDAFRALENPKFILLDEADFFRRNEQEDIRHVSERYIGKSNPFLIMVSTPNRPDGLFEKIEKEPENTCIYKRLKLDYTYGIDRIYTPEEIRKARASPSFSREYDLQYAGLVGNVFHINDIEIATAQEYDIVERSQYLTTTMGIDPGYYAFAIVVVYFVDNKIQVVFADEFQKQSTGDMVEVVWSLIQKYNVMKAYCDASAPSFIRDLKIIWGERPDFDNVKKEHRVWMRCEPVPFQTQHRQMLYHLKFMLENKHIQIDGRRFHKLVTALRTAVAREGVLDKEATSYDDILDAMRLCIRGFEQVQDNDAPGNSSMTWTDDQVASVQGTEEEVVLGQKQREEEQFLDKKDEEEQKEKPKWTPVSAWSVGY
jgi:hypothetical protein